LPSLPRNGVARVGEGLRSDYPLAVRDKLEGLIKMAFGPVFGRAFPAPLSYGAAKTRYTLTLQPSAAVGIDNFLQSANPDTNAGTNVSIFIRTNRVGLLKFTGISAIPAGASIVSATLSLTASVTAALNDTVYINRILVANTSWTELGSTWNHTDGVSRWAGDVGGNGGADAGCSVSGTDYSATLLASLAVLITDPIGTVYNISLNLSETTLMVASNCGMLLRALIAPGNIGFASSDHATAAYWPKFVIVYDA